jgi:hypothetical protein
MQADLQRVRDWAHEKIQGGSEPPWAWFQYMKLIETVDAILAGMAATVTMGSSQQSDQRPGAHLRLVVATGPQDTAQPRPVGPPVQLPM